MSTKKSRKTSIWSFITFLSYGLSGCYSPQDPDVETNGATLDPSPTSFHQALPSGTQAKGTFIVNWNDRLVVGGQIWSKQTSPAALLSRWDLSLNLDPTFGENGIVSLDIESTPSEEYYGPLDEDTFRGAIVDGSRLVTVGVAQDMATVAGAFLIAAYLEDGSLDESFGDHGKTVLPVGDAAAPSITLNTIKSDGEGGYWIGGGLKNPDSWDLFLVRLLADGTPDMQFNPLGGDGFGFIADIDNSHDEIHDLIIQGKNVLVSGRSLIARYDESGTLDPSFGDSGIFRPSRGGVGRLLQTPDGKLLAVGGVNFQTREAVLNGEDVPPDLLVLSKMDHNGQLDRSFGIDGVVETELDSLTLPTIRGAAVDEEGRVIVLLKKLWGGASILRLMPNGSLDLSFHQDGIWHQEYVHPLIELSFFSHNQLLTIGNRIFITDYAVAPDENELVGASSSSLEARLLLVEIPL